MNAAKAVGVGLSGAIATLLIWIANTYGHIDMPDYVQGSIMTIISTGLAYYLPNKQ